jgi:hypothetical protein
MLHSSHMSAASVASLLQMVLACHHLWWVQHAEVQAGAVKVCLVSCCVPLGLPAADGVCMSAHGLARAALAASMVTLSRDRTVI